MFENIENYLDATSSFMGVQKERYGRGYRAIVGLHSDVTFLTDVLTDPGQGGVQIQFFLDGNPAFPASWGETATRALENLNQNLGLLYEFIHTPDKWDCHLKFSFRAQCDSDPGESPEYYKVGWYDVVADLRDAYQKEGDSFFYEIAERTCGPKHYRYLHALRNLTIPDEIKAQLKR